MNNLYLEKHSYLSVLNNDPEISMLIDIMNRRFSDGFETYWHQFGYEIGGPVCYAYTKWVSDAIDADESIDDIAFVARDGYLLKKIYDRMQHRREVNAQYIYAPRAVYHNCQKDKTALKEYELYLKNILPGNKTIAIIDTVTLLFSSQRLIKMSSSRQTKGFFWLVLGFDERLRTGLSYLSFQKEHYHTIWNWNLMEFIMTSPEPPISALRNGLPIYSEKNAFEDTRKEIFTAIESGIMDFVNDFILQNGNVRLSNKCITSWVNGFMKNPSDDDLLNFENVKFSELPDHSDSVPLNPWKPFHDLDNKTLKDKLWYFSLRHKYLYTFLHWGNEQYKHLKVKLKNVKYLKYDGSNTKEILEQAKKYDVISFDIFDTLILRETENPTDVFKLLEKENGIKKFAQIRIESEAFARINSDKLNGEINIYDIYNEVSKRIDVELKSFVEMEMIKEFKVCHKNPDFAPLILGLKQMNKKIIAVSDMYFGADVLQKLLCDCGYDGIEDVYVSNELGVNKGSGKLQFAVWKQLGLQNKVLHIGDNINSDVYQSLSVGWSAVHYKGKK